MSLNVFDFNDYRMFLNKALNERGAKLGLSKHLACQSAYISRVLANHADLSLEQAILTSEFLELSTQENDYFVLLVHHAKAGTHSLKTYYQTKIDSIKRVRDEVTPKLKKQKEISLAEESILFSSWIYSAITLAVRIPDLQTRKAIARYFKLSADQTNQTIDFLLSVGFISEKNGLLESGSSQLHLKKDSPNLLKGEINWRLLAIQSLNQKKSDDFHFFGNYTLSQEAAKQVRRMLIDFIEKVDQTISPSKDEVLYTMCLDWFNI